ncbi:unnamed protein product [Clonostachys byssicola]|uniref:Transcription factor domain-containing protein n=1 Tax=Clonostachys byssicola TaxID=160290 RepID=A0A9N9UKZ7_9HYPO|nr:unnamed protein product [Clonostachys byssicola]
MTRVLSVQGVARLEVIQALCLQTLTALAACKPNVAWMTIGIASRLVSCRALRSDENSNDKDRSLRCRWSVFCLEKIFSPHMSIPAKYLDGLEYPSSAPLPPLLTSAGAGDKVAGLYDSDEAVTDLGINSYYIQMISVWGDVATWLHDIKLGNDEIPWRPESGHTKLSTRYYEFERQLPHMHLLRNVSFTTRTASEIFEQREYWTSWVLMQILFHAVPATINHPFIHLVAVRRSTKGPQSHAFLQQTVDLAIFHSAWVFRILQCSEGFGLEITSPLVGHLVAILAIVPCLFRFAVDEKVSNRAVKDLKWCQDYLARASLIWPHMSQKLDLLRNLQHIADHQRSNHEGGNTIMFQPSLVWALLDPEICHMNTSNEIPDESPAVPEARLRVTTRFTHPLTEAQQEQQPAPSSNFITDENFSFDPDELEQLYLDDLFFHSNPDPFFGL